jgi:hypothetical protein
MLVFGKRTRKPQWYTWPTNDCFYRVDSTALDFSAAKSTAQRPGTAINAAYCRYGIFVCPKHHHSVPPFSRVHLTNTV